MTQDDIIRMAREAGWKDLREFDSEMHDDIFMGKTADLERFAALVSQHEREACAKVCDEVGKESLSHWPHRLATMIRARGNNA